MEKEKMIRQHKITDKNPYLGGVLHFIVIFAVMALVQGIFTFLVTMIAGKNDLLSVFVSILSGIIAYFISLWWFKPELKNVVRMIEPGIFAKYAVFFVVFWIVSIVVGIITSDYKPGLLTPVAFFTAISAGVTEEILFRGCLISPMLRENVDKKRIITATILSSLIFSLIHGANIFVGADPGSTIMQLFSSFLMGIAFGTIYIATGSLLPGIIFHSIHDIIALSNVSSVTENGVIVSKVSPVDFINLLIVLMLALVCIRFSLKDKEDTIIKLWKDTWSNK